jgi:hypothetical protein
MAARTVRLAAVAVVAALSLAPALRAQGTAPKTADEKVIENYRLNEANLARYIKASHNLALLAQQHPESFKDEDKTSDDNATLAQLAAKLDKHPGVKQAIASGGMTTQEFIVFGLATMQAGIGSYAVKQGGKLPPNVMANVAFYDSHRAQFEQLGKEMKAAERKANPGSNDDADAASDSTETPPGR